MEQTIKQGDIVLLEVNIDEPIKSAKVPENISMKKNNKNKEYNKEEKKRIGI